MVQYTNSTLSSSDWELYFQLSSYSKCPVILIILFCGLKIQLQKPNRQRNVKLIKEFKRKVVHILVTLMNWCTYMQNFDDTIIEKQVGNARVIPYENILGILPRKLWQSKNRLP